MPNNALLGIEQMRALSSLIGHNEDRKRYLSDALKHAVWLATHPFDLPHQQPVDRFHRRWLVAHPGVPNFSEEAMAGAILYTTANCLDRDVARFCLRIIKVKDAFLKQQQENCHRVYFELETPIYTYLCGGTADFGGSGESAYRRIGGWFAVVSQLFGIPIAEVWLDEDRGAPSAQTLIALYEKSRAAA